MVSLLDTGEISKQTQWKVILMNTCDFFAIFVSEIKLNNWKRLESEGVVFYLYVICKYVCVRVCACVCLCVCVCEFVCDLWGRLGGERERWV